MRLAGEAAIVGIAELPAERKQTRPELFTLDQYAQLAKMVLDDAGLDAGVVNGIISHGLAESDMFVPATLSEYLGLPIDFGERVDLGGATSAGHGVARRRRGRTRALRRGAGRGARVAGAAALDTAARRRAPTGMGRRATTTGRRRPSTRSRTATSARTPRSRRSRNATAPQYGYDPSALAKIAVDQRTNACAHPGAVFHGKPITEDDVLDSPMIADPIHMLETVMRVHGGTGVLIANADLARRARHRPVWIKGFGEHIAFKTPTYARRADGHADRPGGRDGRSRWPGSAPVRRRRRLDLRLLHDHRADDARGRRASARKGEGMTWIAGARPDLPRRLPAEHRRGSAVLRAGRDVGRHAPRRRRRPPADGALGGRAGARLRTPHSSRAPAAS